MNFFGALVVIFFFITLFAKRSKKSGNKKHHNVYRGPKHGAFKEYVRDREKNIRENFDASINKNTSCNVERNSENEDVKYREETHPFYPTQSTHSTLDKKLAEDSNGVFGEAAVSAIVDRVAHDDNRGYRLLQNVYIPTHFGYTEIDTVLLHESGIYIFETKNLSGEIIGDLEQEHWNLYLNKRTQHTLYNPLKQNQGHIGALLRQLRTSYSRSRVYSFVVFSDRCVLKRVPGLGKNFQVIHFGELKQVFSKILKFRVSVHNKKQIELWTTTLQPCVNVSESVKQAHRERIKKIKQQNKT